MCAPVAVSISWPVMRTRLAALHAAFEDVAHAQFLCHLLHVDRLALVGEGRIAGDDEEPRQSRDRRRDLLDHAVDEIFLLGISGHVLEWQHRH